MTRFEFRWKSRGDPHGPGVGSGDSLQLALLLLPPFVGLPEDHIFRVGPINGMFIDGQIEDVASRPAEKVLTT